MEDQAKPSKRILLVEDEAIIALAESRLLEAEGYRVVVAHSGEVAVEALAPGREWIDLVLMDIDLGKGIDGPEAARRMLAIRDLPIVFLSSHTEKAVVDRTEAVSSYGYVVKDSGATVLFASIRMAFRLFAAKARAEESERRMRDTMESARLITVQLDVDGRLAFCNDFFLRLTGWTRGEILGSSWFERFIPDEERTTIGELFRRCIETGSLLSNHENGIVCRSGERRLISWSNTILRDTSGRVVGASSLGEDITESRRAEAAILERDRRIRAIFESMDQGLAYLEPSGKVLECNPAAEAIMGIPRGSLAGKNLFGMLKGFKRADGEPYLDEERPSWIAATKGLPARSPMIALVRPDGTTVWIIATATPEFEAGRLVRIMTTYTDVTRVVEAERAMRRSEEERLALLAAIPDLIFLTDGEGVFLDYHADDASRLIAQPELFIGRSMREFLSPDLVERYAGAFKDAAASGSPVPIEYEAVAAGRVRRYEARVTRSAPGKFLSIVRDITDEKGCREREERHRARLEGLIAVLEGPAERVQDILDKALDQAIRVAESAIGYILLYDEGRELFTINSWPRGAMAECSIEKPPTSFRLADTGIWGEAVRQRRAIILNDYEAENPLKRGLPSGHARLRNFLTVPIFSEGAIVAVVGVANKESNYDQGDVLQLTLLMDSVWKVMERKRSEEELAETNALFHAFLERSPIYVFFKDHEVRPFLLSSNYESLIGRPLDKILGRSMDELFPPELAGPMIEDDRRVLFEGRLVEREEVLGDRYFTTVKFPVPIEGKPSMLAGFTIDITERKLMEKSLEAALAEKAALLKELQHRVKNTLQMVHSMVDLEMGKGEDTEKDASIARLAGRVGALNELYATLFASGDASSVLLGPYILGIARSLVGVYSPSGASISLGADVAELRLDAKRASTVGLIVNELVTNALKYGYPEGGEGRIRIALREEERDIVVVVADDGKGPPPGFDAAHGSGTGLLLAAMLAKQLAGSFSLVREGGETLAALRLPSA